MSLKTGTSQHAVFAILLAIGSVLLTIILVEAVLRLFSGSLPVELQRLMEADPKNYGIAHTYIGHLHKPNSAFVISGRDFKSVHHTDGHGFRNRWPWPETAEIVALGDSLTFGQGVRDEEAWPAILDRALPRSGLINLGLIGAGPTQYQRVYETFGRKFHPKLVLVGFFIRNDFWDEEMFDRWLRSGVGGNYMVWRDFGRPKRVTFNLEKPVASMIDTFRWNYALLSRSSYLYSLLLHVRGAVKEWRPGEVRTFEFPDGDRMELFPGDFAKTTAGAQPDRREFQLTIQALQRIQSIARANGTHVLVIFQPSKEEVYLPLLGVPPPDPAGPLRAALNQSGIRYLDLTPVFRQRAKAGEKLFFEVDGHPNARGYSLIAKLVFSHLKDNAKRYDVKDLM